MLLGRLVGGGLNYGARRGARIASDMASAIALCRVPSWSTIPTARPCRPEMQSPRPKSAITRSSVVFRPTGPGSRTANLTINHNAAGSPLIVGLSGTGTNRNATLCLNSERLVFPAQRVGTAGPELTVTLTNCGQSPLVIQNVAISGNRDDFIENSNRRCNGVIIPVNGICTVGYQFRPMTTGNRVAVLTINSNSQQGQRQIEMTGTGN